MPGEVQNPQVDEHFRLINRVISYPAVTTLLESAKGYYSSAKGSSDLVKKSCETFESTLEGSLHWIQPRVEPVLESNLAKPLLSTVDDFGCRQLDRIENISKVYQNSRQLIEARVTDIKTSTIAYAEAGKQTLETKVVPNVDSYLKDSLIAGPLNLAITVTERVADRILPQEQQEEKSKNENQDQSAGNEQNQQVALSTSGPIYRAGKLSKRISNQTLTKLRNLSLRTPDRVQAMTYCVDLIQYAADHLDAGVKSTNAKLMEVGKKVHISEVTEKLQQTSSDAFKALSTAVEVLASHVPGPVNDLRAKTLENLRVRVQELKSRKEVTAFVQVAQNGVAKLKEANGSLTHYIESNGQLPLQLTKVTGLVNNVLDSLTTQLNLEKAGNEQENSQNNVDTQNGNSDDDLDVIEGDLDDISETNKEEKVESHSHKKEVENVDDNERKVNLVLYTRVLRRY